MQAFGYSGVSLGLTSPQVQERVQRRLYNLNLIWRLRDGSTLLPDLNEIREARMPDTCRTNSSDNLPPTVDKPKAIIRKKNAERRCLAKSTKSKTSRPTNDSVTPLATEPQPSLSSSTTPLNVPSPFLSTTDMQPSELRYTPRAFSNPSGSTSKDGQNSSNSAFSTIPKAEDQSTNELIRLLLLAQHANTVQSLADRQAMAADRRTNLDCLAHFEQAIL
ncbi:hypothetical protein VP01_4007g1 [Puccinia sorghi]|uniref:Uncharacterized protein n=1 Tax=Puccinia sorghi TaxID=27349 RepID=A0A0L6US02_9BASI|nr:hypothetical protein VP01_4007g1 [Puccinia sorghi]